MHVDCTLRVILKGVCALQAAVGEVAMEGVSRPPRMHFFCTLREILKGPCPRASDGTACRFPGDVAIEKRKEGSARRRLMRESQPPQGDT